MADPRGPKLALGDTEAGKDIADSVEKGGEARANQAGVSKGATSAGYPGAEVRRELV